MQKTIKDKRKQNESPVFARHETFHPRFGWLKKGFDKAIENPAVFLSEAAPTILGAILIILKKRGQLNVRVIV